jgi:hypothetical protein
MNMGIEETLKSWLEQDGVTVKVNTGLSADIIENDEQTVFTSAENSDHRVGPLQMVTARFIITTPSHMDEDDDGNSALQSHQNLSDQVRSLVEGWDSSNLRTTFDTERSPDEFRGAFFVGEEPTVSEGGWITTLTLNMGVFRGS